MSDYQFITFVLEVITAGTGLVFGWLTWASGYLGYLVRSAKRNRWGLDLLRKRSSGATEWEDTFNP